MNLKHKIWTAIFLVFSLLVLATSAWADPVMDRKIIIYKVGTTAEKQAKLLAKVGASKIHDLTFINAQSVMVPPGKAKELAADPNVLLVEDDIQMQALASQTVPWGIDRIAAPACWPLNPDGGIDGTIGDPVKVAVVDTGISLLHPDLAANIKGGFSAVTYTRYYTDDNGHGSHVAGIIGALNNTVGVVGVGPKIDLYAVKVLNKKGSGYVSDIAKGLQWCIGNGIQVVNMSLGSTQSSTTLAAAVAAAYDAKIVLVAAAGNDGKAVNYPAAYPGVIAVGATDINNNLASFSSRGAALDLVAPGVSILSTYKGTTYATLSGTSMASPHVAGAAALLIDAGITPDRVEAQLKAGAKDLGAVGRDNLFGSGLVNVYQSIK